jgi:hypothetical protein
MKSVIYSIVALCVLAVIGCSKDDNNTFQYACFCSYSQVDGPDTSVVFHYPGNLSRDNAVSSCSANTAAMATYPHYRSGANCKVQ